MPRMSEIFDPGSCFDPENEAPFFIDDFISNISSPKYSKDDSELDCMSLAEGYLHKTCLENLQPCQRCQNFQIFYFTGRQNEGQINGAFEKDSGSNHFIIDKSLSNDLSVSNGLDENNTEVNDVNEIFECQFDNEDNVDDVGDDDYDEEESGINQLSPINLLDETEYSHSLGLSKQVLSNWRDLLQSLEYRVELNDQSSSNWENQDLYNLEQFSQQLASYWKWFHSFTEDEPLLVQRYAKSLKSHKHPKYRSTPQELLLQSVNAICLTQINDYHIFEPSNSSAASESESESGSKAPSAKRRKASKKVAFSNQVLVCFYPTEAMFKHYSPGPGQASEFTIKRKTTGYRFTPPEKQYIRPTYVPVTEKVNTRVFIESWHHYIYALRDTFMQQPPSSFPFPLAPQSENSLNHEHSLSESTESLFAESVGTTGGEMLGGIFSTENNKPLKSLLKNSNTNNLPASQSQSEPEPALSSSSSSTETNPTESVPESEIDSPTTTNNTISNTPNTNNNVSEVYQFPDYPVNISVSRTGRRYAKNYPSLVYFAKANRRLNYNTSPPNVTEYAPQLKRLGGASIELQLDKDITLVAFHNQTDKPFTN